MRETVGCEMAKFFDTITPSVREFIAEQKIFFVATAPVSGRINLSPKGMDTFRVIDERTVAYLDLTGSGNETSAHLEENGRITIMMCSFTAKPNIFRIYGRGRVVRPGDGDWAMVSTNFELLPGTRQIFVVTIESMQDSCGFSIPFYEYIGPREQLVRWAEVKGEDGLAEYRATKNCVSIDGLPTGLNGK
jgi:hypothetical protein